MEENSEKPTVLLVDDDPDQLLILGNYLEKYNYNVISSEGAVKGLELMENNKVDIILCDVMMPEVCGHELLNTVKGNPRYAQTPVIMLSAADYYEDFALNSGADKFYNKSSNVKELIADIEELIEEVSRIATTV